jgi:hypothetical protein
MVDIKPTLEITTCRRDRIEYRSLSICFAEGRIDDGTQREGIIPVDLQASPAAKVSNRFDAVERKP